MQHSEKSAVPSQTEKKEDYGLVVGHYEVLSPPTRVHTQDVKVRLEEWHRKLASPVLTFKYRHRYHESLLRKSLLPGSVKA